MQHYTCTLFVGFSLYSCNNHFSAQMYMPLALSLLSSTDFASENPHMSYSLVPGMLMQFVHGFTLFIASFLVVPVLYLETFLLLNVGGSCFQPFSLYTRFIIENVQSYCYSGCWLCVDQHTKFLVKLKVCCKSASFLEPSLFSVVIWYNSISHNS